MGSKGRIPPAHMRRPLSGPDPFGPGMRPPHGAYPPFDMLPPPQVMEQKLAAQHVEMQRLVVENQRLAATHGNLRQELAGAQHELQILHAQIGAIKSEREQQMSSLVDSIAKMEADLKSAEPVKAELQNSRAEAQSLVVSRQELITKVQQLGQDLQRTHADVQQIPALVAQLDGLRQEYQLCRDTYDYEKRLYSSHLESLQVMEKNYVTMAREVEKLRAELLNNSNVDRRTGAPYYGTPGNNENEATGQAMGQNAFEDSYGVQQGRVPFPPATAACAVAAGAGGAAATGTPPLVGAQSGPLARTGYDAPRGPGYDPSGGPAHDAQRGPAYDSQRGPAYDPQRGPAYDAQRPGYDVQRPGYEVQRVPGYDPTRGVNYDTQSRAAGGGPQGHMPTGNVHYGSATTPPARGGSGYEAPPPRGLGGGNPVRR
ncbi:LOW QUALITY PROTEIN: protein FLX-like 2 [Pyrus x bretschneideri]|uniref:LOW QUALITY PROTEIN: protein FLX-like 2 n=1 Tax=Pyrus x bretschneideri TaxID=225117 RepID=UPI00202DEE4D|nr:LOW QUALITY PROTEIN: protein FLX-like 2 [Pyrus x bretschneideri]